MNIVKLKMGTRLGAGCARILAVLACAVWLGSGHVAMARERMDEFTKVNELLSPQASATRVAVTPCNSALRSRSVGDPSGMFDSEMQRTQAAAAEAERAESSSRAILLIMAACAMAAACVMAWAITRGVTRRINTANIASGRLDLPPRKGHPTSVLAELASTVKQHAARAHEARRQADHAPDAEGKVLAITLASKKLDDIIRVIDGIAEQTNILALNAVLEAARAGRQGRGFAVVASEMRNLADRSSAAAKEIELLLQESVGTVRGGGELFSKACATLCGVVDSVQRVTEILAAVSEMHNNAAQQDAALVKESAAAAAALRDQASTLARLVGSLKLDDFGA
jgi:methyl-accepting chemotaxis protein